MGQKISTNFVQSTHKVNDIDLRFQINGPIQQSATGRSVCVEIDGHLYIESGIVHTVSQETKNKFIEFVKTDRFAEYIKGVLFLKNSDFPRTFQYNVPQSTIKNLSWVLENVPEASFDADTFTVKLQFKLEDPTHQENTLRSSVVYMSKSLIDALEMKRAEDMPITDNDGNVLKFGPDNISFSLV